MAKIKAIISGGGTGGHIFPAVAIAKTLQQRHPDAEILFVGAEGKMEMEKVPKAGFQIVGLPIVGIQRRLTWKNLLVPFKLLKSLMKARRVIKEFKPDIAIGVGGYASGPLLNMATRMNIRTVIQEQNSFPGITNKILSKKVNTICTAYEGLEKFFPADKIILTGNPIRPDVAQIAGKRDQAIAHFNLDSTKKTILVVGGSLGARTINNALIEHCEALTNAGLQVLWQTGKTYYENTSKAVASRPNVHVHEFIYEMDLAYACADIIVSRAGAMSISELCLIGKPIILVPSPNVSEDHQTKNAMALVNKQAAVLVKDVDAQQELHNTVLALASNEEEMSRLGKNILMLAKPKAADSIVDEIEKLVLR